MSSWCSSKQNLSQNSIHSTDDVTEETNQIHFTIWSSTSEPPFHVLHRTKTVGWWGQLVVSKLLLKFSDCPF